MPSPARSPMPTIFVPHGGGPWPFVDLKMGSPEQLAQLRGFLTGLKVDLATTPKAILVVSAHWEAAKPTVMTHSRPPMLYDYHGFPREAYEITWPAPGAPEMAQRVRELLDAANIATLTDANRGFDHGTFVVTKLMDPEAVIPTFQLSLKAGLDPLTHLQMGEALAPLRDEGVLILGSGMSYHNMRGFGQAMRGNIAPVRDASRAFDEWLVEAMHGDAGKRRQALVEWAKAPSARACHPREEHLLPLMVVAGAGYEGQGTAPYRSVLMGAHVCAIRFA